MQPFINADISLYLFRNPESEWLCLQCAGRGEQSGVTVSSANLFDEKGLFGQTTISAISNPLPE